MARLLCIRSRHLMGPNIQLTKDGGFGGHRDSKQISYCKSLGAKHVTLRHTCTGF
jgi:hypothetical protein